MELQYHIYILVGKDKIEPDGYYSKTVTNYTLQEPSIGLMLTRHTSMEDAVAECRAYENQLRGYQITILPIIKL